MTNVLLAAMLVLTTAPAFAQTLPKSSDNPLEEICSGFLEQSRQSISGDRAKLCTCLVPEIQRRLTRPEMEAYAAAGVEGQQPPPAVM